MECKRFLFSCLLSVSAALCFATGSAFASKDLFAEKNTLADLDDLQKSSANTCTSEQSPITINVGPNEEEATFKCDGSLTTLEPADCSGDACQSPVVVTLEQPKAQMIYDEEKCETPKLLEDVFPGATRKDNVHENTYTLTIPKKNRKQKDAWYQCKSALLSRTNNSCKVKISVAAGPTEDQSDDTTCSQEGSSITINVGAEQEEATFKCGGSLTTLDPVDCPGGSCPAAVATFDVQPVQMIYDDEKCQTAKPLEDVFPGAKRVDGSPENTYRLTIPKKNRKKKDAWYQCKSALPRSNNPCKVKITVAAGPSEDLSDDTTCSQEGSSITINVGAEQEEATFKCGGSLTTLDPADCPGGSCPAAVATFDVQPVQMIYDDEKCETPKLLEDVFPGATREDGSTENTYRLTIPKKNRKKKDAWYQCKSGLSRSNNPCKVKITVAAGPSEDLSDDTTCSQEGSSITINVGAEQEEATFKCGGSLTTLDPADCSGGSCSPVMATFDVQPVQMIYDDEKCQTAKPLEDVFPGATREDGSPENTYRLTIPKKNRKQKDAWYQCKTNGRTKNPCKVKISVSAGPEEPPAPSTENICTAGGVLNVNASPETPLKFVCPEDLPLKPTNKNRVYDNSDDRCHTEVDLSTLVDAELTGATPAILEPGASLYTLNVKKLPQKKALLCYKCATNNNLETLRRSNGVESNDCLVKVEIEADPTATTSSTQTPTTSSAITPESTLAASCNVLIVGLLAGAIHTI
ncbi:SRS domain-containing protein [Neospora caninum Liverpool]|uniref:SRS domain-containing protein n=1 Tax=Neospora caninum (strain Liverpool) TaxID=572307 RepID=F0VGU3_NEOCL|nr:SRS domain-containing protein [Neospora caninum Liverpool]CBZ52937.1 SRS domain-containing protein [Neospora caninum Liverpool]CEL66921.1 TPA: SRS domain-containing protein [Neospora caninum Liverpool]|eukprot:XP_003882969.1 SRS domain-containing protein [Neospora caninum Liverpool]